MGSLIESALGGDWGKESPDEKYTEQVRVIRGTDMYAVGKGNVAGVPIRYIEKKKYKTRKLRPGDILIEISGGSNAQSTGRSLYVGQVTLELLGGAAIPASFCRLIRARSLKKATVLFTYLEYLYTNGRMWDYQNRSTGISNFQFKYFVENVHIKDIPPEQESNFYDYVLPLLNKRAENAQNIQTLTNLRDSLLPRLISGKTKL